MKKMASIITPVSSIPDDARDKQLADGRFGGSAIDHHDNGRRDQNSERTGVADNTGGKFPAVSRTDHAGNDNRTDRYDSRGG
jgi:hypothetical protein